MTPTSLVYNDDDGNVVVDRNALVAAVEAPLSGAFVLVPFELCPWKFYSPFALANFYCCCCCLVLEVLERQAVLREVL